ncbi:hypothetical protein IHE44_0005715 [Lamprotornis superbus]|uniref:Uncharacterized protein n=1 Tax=Lamprotornis superbus TaxID=245042 RepID=A0A835NLU3_9PASS|nr:hypothetical protein IHE44_0005715 [Lamprotornis superbus]
MPATGPSSLLNHPLELLNLSALLSRLHVAIQKELSQCAREVFLPAGAATLEHTGYMSQSQFFPETSFVHDTGLLILPVSGEESEERRMLHLNNLRKWTNQSSHSLTFHSHLPRQHRSLIAKPSFQKRDCVHLLKEKVQPLLVENYGLKTVADGSLSAAFGLKIWFDACSAESSQHSLETIVDSWILELVCKAVIVVLQLVKAPVRDWKQSKAGSQPHYTLENIPSFLLISLLQLLQSLLTAHMQDVSTDLLCSFCQLVDECYRCLHEGDPALTWPQAHRAIIPSSITAARRSSNEHGDFSTCLALNDVSEELQHAAANKAMDVTHMGLQYIQELVPSTTGSFLQLVTIQHLHQHFCHSCQNGISHPNMHSSASSTKITDPYDRSGLRVQPSWPSHISLYIIIELPRENNLSISPASAGNSEYPPCTISSKASSLTATPTVRKWLQDKHRV